MTKELDTIKYLLEQCPNETIKKDLLNIETALKDLSWYKEQLRDFDIKENQLRETFIVYKNYQADKKKLKALEIIKENFVPYDIEMLKNGKVRIWVGHDKYFDVDKKEYDLLKEVLL